MTVKIIEPPVRKGDSYIIAVDGHLRFVDPLRGHTCMGYANACVCSECLARAEKVIVIPSAACQCEHPIRDAETNDCWKCGHEILLKEAA